MKKQTVKLVTLLLLVLVSAGCRGEDPGPNTVAVHTVTADTAENRHARALRLIERYSMDEWRHEVLRRVAEQLGSQVSQEFSDQVRARMSDKELLEFRIKLLTDTFSVDELSLLEEWYGTARTRALLRKLPEFDAKLKESMEPRLTEILTGMPTEP